MEGYDEQVKKPLTTRTGSLAMIISGSFLGILLILSTLSSVTVAGLPFVFR
jgi:hypothetical protein